MALRAARNRLFGMPCFAVVRSQRFKQSGLSGWLSRGFAMAFMSRFVFKKKGRAFEKPIKSRSGQGKNAGFFPRG